MACAGTRAHWTRFRSRAWYSLFESECALCLFFFFSSRRRHTRFDCDWSSDVCSSDLTRPRGEVHGVPRGHPGLRGDECRLCHVFPEGSTRALDGGRERARGGRAGGDRVYRDGGLDRGRPRHRPLTVRVDIQMSRLGRPLGANTLPGRLEVQTNVWPSKDRLGCWSKAAELSGAPGFSGVDHGSFAVRRVATQRSERPRPPAGAPRWNQISFPSVRTVGAASLAAGWLSSARNTAGPAVSPSRVTGA